MIDKVVTLENDLTYYILDEYTSEDGNNYVFGVQIDAETDALSTNYIFLKAIGELNDTRFDNITDKDEYLKIGNIFLNRLTN
ncbi:MAG: DUF1292 domain-containing protein [Bacilli bacterium]|nr:hypothetical protein [bacterium]